jgi:hypothetical protein
LKTYREEEEENERDSREAEFGKKDVVGVRKWRNSFGDFAVAGKTLVEIRCKTVNQLVHFVFPLLVYRISFTAFRSVCVNLPQFMSFLFLYELLTPHTIFFLTNLFIYKKEKRKKKEENGEHHYACVLYNNSKKEHQQYIDETISQRRNGIIMLCIMHIVCNRVGIMK